MKKRTGVLLLAGIFAAAPLLPQFGGVVTDPLQEAHSAQQLVYDLQKLRSLAQQYQLAVQMAMRMRTRASWLTAATPALNQLTLNRYGETINWSAAMNGNWTQIPMAYGNATTRLSPTINLSNETLGSSYHLANLATVETMDSSNTACLQAAAQYRQSQQANQPASNSLLAAGTDESDATNSVIAQLNQLNGGSAEQRAEDLSRGTLQACLVEQQALANTVTRNNQVEALNMFAQVDQTEVANPMQLSNMSTSLNAVIQ